MTLLGPSHCTAIPMPREMLEDEINDGIPPGADPVWQPTDLISFPGGPLVQLLNGFDPLYLYLALLLDRPNEKVTESDQ